MEEIDSIPTEVFEEAREATLRLLPAKSKELYEKEFAEFNSWREKQRVRIINEEVMLSYFYNIKKKYAVSSAWSKYSMLKATLKVNENIDISKYSKLTAYLKSESKGYKSKKAAVLEREHIERFLTMASDEEYLMINVALIMGIAGACRCCELTNLKINDVQDTGSYLLVSIPDTKTYISRNPRNKCALGPGHSLMDWIRLGQSGRDLTGLGRRAGTLSVSPRQLAEHTEPQDAWLAIRGKVYNVSAYLAFHPGGPDELMKGVGKDATDMFNEVHAWVNYESILQKCLVGRLTAVEPDVDTEALFYGTATSPSSTCTTATATSPGVTNGAAPAPAAASIPASSPPPRFDWIQKMDYITTIFYTKAYCNPQVQITAPTKQNEVSIILSYSSSIYTNNLRFAHNIHWPCRVSINCETGKVEVKFRKILSKVWESYGSLAQNSTSEPGADVDGNTRVKYIVMNKLQVNHNSWMLALQRGDGVKQTVPVGKHVRVHGSWNGQDISRSYTPIPSVFMTSLQPNSTQDVDHEAFIGDVCLLVKGYPTGMLSPWLCARAKGDALELSRPHGAFELRLLENREAVLLLAAGTGITPMLGVMMFLLDRRQKRCQKVSLLFFNRREEDILCRAHLHKLQKEDSRLTVQHILSEPSPSWHSQSGHVSATLVRDAVNALISDTHLLPADVFTCACGPTVFTNLARTLLSDMGYRPDHMHCFQG